MARKLAIWILAIVGISGALILFGRFGLVAKGPDLFIKRYPADRVTRIPGYQCRLDSPIITALAIGLSRPVILLEETFSQRSIYDRQEAAASAFEEAEIEVGHQGEYDTAMYTADGKGSVLFVSNDGTKHWQVNVGR